MYTCDASLLLNTAVTHDVGVSDTHLDEAHPIPLLSSMSSYAGQIPCRQLMSQHSRKDSCSLDPQAAAMTSIIDTHHHTLSSPLFNHCRPGCTFCPLRLGSSVVRRASLPSSSFGWEGWQWRL